MSDSARQAWKRWWDDEGSGIQPSIAQSDEDFARYITEIAWSNGAYARSAEIERLRAELVSKADELAAMKRQRDEARKEVCRHLSMRCAVLGVHRSSQKHAIERGWDCYAQEGGGSNAG